MITCKKEGCGAAILPSTWDGTEVQTLVGYYSPPGHKHDDNCLKRTYICANGHENVLSIQRRCSVKFCEWRGKTSCFCSTVVEKWPS